MSPNLLPSLPHVKYYFSLHQRPPCLLGGNIRIGMEDTLYLEKGKHTFSNKELVEKSVVIMKLLDKEPATPEEAKDLMQLR